jgi:hypothetical protein
MPAAEISCDIDPSKPLDNPRHETFARLVGNNEVNADWKAYQIAYGCSRESAESQAFQLRKDLGISRRVAWFLSQAATASTMNMRERRERLARIVRANVTKLDLEADGDLVQEITHDGETGAIVKIKLPGKRECIETDAKLAGEWDSGPRSEPGHGQQRMTVAITQLFGIVESRVCVGSVVDTEALTDGDVASNPESVKEPLQVTSGQ